MVKKPSLEELIKKIRVAIPNIADIDTHCPPVAACPEELGADIVCGEGCWLAYFGLEEEQ